MKQFVSAQAINQRSNRWRVALIVTALVAVQVVGALFVFGAKNSYAWFGSGHCTMPGGFVSGGKCMAADTVSGKEIAQQPYKGEIIFPAGTTTITDHVIFNGSSPVTGNYELQLLEDEGGALNVYQTIDYTVDSAGDSSPASFTLNSTVLHKAFVDHPVGSGGLIGYFLFISNTNLPANATCQNTVAYSGANGSLGNGTSAANVECGPPTKVPNTGALAGHIYDCTSGVADTSADVSGGSIAVTTGPATKPAAANPVSYPVVPSGDYAESATPPAGYHFTYTCGGTSSGTDSAATEAVHVPVSSLGVGIFYLVHDSGTITGHIYDCTGGTANLISDIAGGTIAVSGPANKPAAANPITYSVPSGDYVETAVAPANYHLVACTNPVSTDSNTANVTVPKNGEGTASFYVARDTGDLAAHIYDCTSGATANEVAGGMVSASGPSTVAEQANPLSPTVVDSGAYNVSASNPASYHFVFNCGGSSSGTDTSATESVTVPVNGHGVGIFYVARDQGQLAGHIYDCTSGATTSEVNGGTLAAGGPQNVATQSNPMNPTTVLTGDYGVTGGLPSGYHWIACNGTNGSNSANVTVPKGGIGTAILYVAKNSTPSPGGTGATSVVKAATAPVQAVLGAATTAPNTGRGGLLQAGLWSLVLLVIGGVTLVLTRSRRREELSS